MATPNKIFMGFSTPNRYPSQSPDFLPLDNSGHSRNNFKMHQEPYKGRESPYKPKYNNRKQNFNNSRNNFQNNTKRQFHDSPKKIEYDFSVYFHPSMLQDPWEHLMRRHEELSASKITEQQTSIE